jgi:hypothetical protein
MKNWMQRATESSRRPQMAWVQEALKERKEREELAKRLEQENRQYLKREEEKRLEEERRYYWDLSERFMNIYGSRFDPIDRATLDSFAAGTYVPKGEQQLLRKHEYDRSRMSQHDRKIEQDAKKRIYLSSIYGYEEAGRLLHAEETKRLRRAEQERKKRQSDRRKVSQRLLSTPLYEIRKRNRQEKRRIEQAERLRYSEQAERLRRAEQAERLRRAEQAERLRRAEQAERLRRAEQERRRAEQERRRAEQERRRASGAGSASGPNIDTDPYVVLGLPNKSQISQVNKAYKKLAIAYHPDKTGGDDTNFKRIGHAKDFLDDPNVKAMYNSGTIGYNYNYGMKSVRKTKKTKKNRY